MNCADAFNHTDLLGQPSCSVQYASVAPKTGLMTVLRAEKWKWYGGGPRCTLQMKRENASESWRPVGDLDAGCKGIIKMQTTAEKWKCCSGSFNTGCK